MSKYTTEVRFICETAAGYRESQPYSKVNEIIQKAIPSVFSFNFPIFDENYRNVLCTKILRHYYTREICEEVVGLWKLRLETRLNEIMPYYNQLYKEEIIEREIIQIRLLQVARVMLVMRIAVILRTQTLARICIVIRRKVVCRMLITKLI